MPRKLGQHFLIRESVLEQVAEAAAPPSTARVVEIGPGRGALTRSLLRRTDELHAIEIDAALVEYLTAKFSSESKLHVHLADVLKTDLAQWGPAALAGNLPYYITSPIVEKFLKLDQSFSTAVFLMQYEVAQRILSGPGTRAYGYLTVSTQVLCDVQLVCRVPAAAFAPPPKVESAAVRFVRKTRVPKNLSSLLTLVSRSFAMKRKTLRNNLRPFYGPMIDDLPEAGLRAEQLDIGQFVDLHDRIFSYTETS